MGFSCFDWSQENVGNRQFLTRQQGVSLIHLECVSSR